MVYARLTKLIKLQQATFSARPSIIWVLRQDWHGCYSPKKISGRSIGYFYDGAENVKILPIIMCGGSGTRVWPESRESLPKQFISLIGVHSTFQMAAEKLADPMCSRRPSSFPIPITAFSSPSNCKDRAARRASFSNPFGGIPGPPSRSRPSLPRNPAPDTIVAVLAADHVVRDRAGFRGFGERRRPPRRAAIS